MTSAMAGERSSDPGVDSPPEERRIAHVMRLLEGHHRHYQQAAMDEAAELGRALAPPLIELLEKTVASPKTIIRFAEDGYAGHLYALALLAHLRATDAHEVILALARLPEPLSEPLLGEAVSELLPAALYRTSGGSLQSLEQLATDSLAPVNCRDAALGAMVFAVLDGAADRTALLHYFGTLLTEEDRAKAGMDFVTCVVTRACDLCPDVIQDLVEQSFKRGRVDPFAISLADVDHLLAAGESQVLAESRRAMHAAMPDEVHGYLTRWMEFEEPPKSREDTQRDAKARQRALEKKRREQRKRTRKARRRKR